MAVLLRGQYHGGSHRSELTNHVNCALKLRHLLECRFHHKTILPPDPVDLEYLWDSLKRIEAVINICMGCLQANERTDLSP